MKDEKVRKEYASLLTEVSIGDKKKSQKVK